MATYYLGGGNDLFSIGSDNLVVYGQGGNDTIQGGYHRHIFIDGGEGSTRQSGPNAAKETRAVPAAPPPFLPKGRPDDGGRLRDWQRLARGRFVGRRRTIVKSGELSPKEVRSLLKQLGLPPDAFE